MTEPIEIYVDGGSRGNPGPSACAFVIPKLNRCASKFLGARTNNEAEYCALLLALTYAVSQAWTRVRVFSDSQLVVKQLNGEFAIREPRIQVQVDTVRGWISKFDSFEITLIKRNKNREADKLCNAELNRHA